MDNKILIISIIAIIGFVVVSYFAFNKPTQTYYPEQSVARGSAVKGKSDSSSIDHKKGTGKNILIEYSDLQCPACKMFHEYIENEKKSDKEFAKLMSEDYTFIYRHFPLTQLHKNAEMAAKAAEAAAMQDKYYEFIDRAFATQSQWEASDAVVDFFLKIVMDLGLDEKKFLADIESDTVKNKIQIDTEAALKGNVDATPTFFANGVKLSGYTSFEEFKKLLIEAKNQPSQK